MDGTGTVATFNNLKGITTDGTNLYVIDGFNNKIRKIAPTSGTLSSMTSATAVVSSLTGTANTPSASGAADGAGTAATFFYPDGITTDGTNLYVVDSGNSKVRKIAPSSGTLSSMTSATAVVSSLTGAANTPGPTISTCTATPSACAVDGPGATATFYYPNGITSDGTDLYVVDTYNNKIRKIQ
jgi:sugar lactone lactonase YvrE